MSEIKVNKISPRTNCGTVQLGDSGDTITIPSGATITNNGTASGFGATGSASWNTTVKTSGFTAVAGEGYFVDTTSGSISVNLPAGTAGAVVAFKDYAGTFSSSNKVTLVQNGSDKIGGSTVNATLETEGIAVTLVFIDSTQGWLVTDSGLQDEVPTAQFVAATGGTITTVCTNFKVHTFTGPGTFQVTCAGNAGGSNEISYLVVAGGGGGSANGGGGGGAGGYREGKSPQTPYTASPLACTSGSNNGLPVAVASYPVTVGGGGPGVSSGRSTDGTNSVFAGTTTITSTGGGGSGTYCGSAPYDNPAIVGAPGGSGGGGGAGPGSASSLSCVPAANKGTGNTPPVSPSQGNPGGRGLHSGNYSPTGAVGGGGGGGAGGPGGEPVLSPGKGGTGGVGTPTQITGSAVSYAGGAGGGIGPGTGFTTPAGSPCGTGGAGGKHPGTDAIAGTTNRGGGGGGGGHQPQGGANGGSGIVVIRYKFQ
jgi:hypothetical protein